MLSGVDQASIAVFVQSFPGSGLSGALVACQRSRPG